MTLAVCCRSHTPLLELTVPGRELTPELRDAVAPFVAAARRAGGRAHRPGGATVSTGSTPRGDRENTTAIRQWAREHGHKISDRGRIPRSVLEAFAKASD